LIGDRLDNWRLWSPASGATALAQPYPHHPTGAVGHERRRGASLNQEENRQG